MTCPTGMILRKGYTYKSRKIPKGCIKAQSQSGKKRVDIDRAIIRKLGRIHVTMRKKFGTPSCKRGEIVREGYIRKSGKQVAPGCIKGDSTKKKGKQLFVLSKGTLSQYGYHTDLSKKDRHTTLRRALRHIKPLSVYRKLNALYILNKNRPLGSLYKGDAEWVKITTEYARR
jgi:hypothetical protein